jgi:hypothetical protein
VKKIAIIFLLSLFYAVSFAQDRKSSWRVGVNPLALAESQISVGPAVAYRYANRFELWSEVSCIFANSYMPRHWKNMKGLRFILQTRYYLGESKAFFVTPELRLKTYSFDNSLNFINATTADTLNAFPFKERQFLAGGALVLGRQYHLSKKNGLKLEITAGLGAKHRFIKRKNIPGGYRFNNIKGGFALKPAYEDDNTGTVLFPVGFRLMWEIN